MDSPNRHKPSIFPIGKTSTPHPPSFPSKFGKTLPASPTRSKFDRSPDGDAPDSAQPVPDDDDVSAYAFEDDNSDERREVPEPLQATTAAALVEFEVDPSEESFEAHTEVRELRCRAPNESTYVRIAPRTAILRCVRRKIAGSEYDRWEYFLATERVALEVPLDAGKYELYLWCGFDGSEGALLLPARPRDPYNVSLREFVQIAQTTWARFVKSGEHRGSHRAADDLGEPSFRELDKAQVVDAVFGTRRIASIDHPVIRELLGKK